ncbi:hypothetical protein ACH5RR_018106 [Cinchona calisaya]|uniref:Uncharacterized protein n=1 Tax=Cinchona calisaya TaxID=153742 RepID=A0ABD2ZKI0_9GENT
MWLRDEMCKEVIQKAWCSDLMGSPEYSLHKRLMNTKDSLKTWNRNHFGDCQNQIALLQKAIQNIQDGDHKEENLAIEASLQIELDARLKRAESLWCQKSRISWTEEGDANTRFFHLMTIVHHRAIEAEATKVKCYLDELCYWSGQKVNMDKSSIHFSMNCKREIKSAIC